MPSRICSKIVAAVAFALSVAGPTEARLDRPTELTTVEGEGYSIEAGDVVTAAGGEARILVTIMAKPGFEVEEKYPHKVKLDDPPDGVELPKRELTKEDATFVGESALVIPVPVRPLRAGRYAIGLEVKTVVYTKEMCRIVKERLIATVTAR